MLLYNISVHEGTKCTPYELALGKFFRESSGQPSPYNKELQTYDDHLMTIVT